MNKSVELYVGAGGLALGAARAGFRHIAVLDWNKSACETLRRNKSLGVEHVREWEIIEADAREVDFGVYASEVQVVFGGPPCQPFSLGGRHRGHEDRRDGFPDAVRAICQVQPLAFMFENVAGLLRTGFAQYFRYVLLQLRFPTEPRASTEHWTQHLARLERIETSRGQTGLRYDVRCCSLDAADFGVPQRRKRVFLVGIRTDLDVQFAFPTGTFSEDALLRDQWLTGVYWDRHRIPNCRRPPKPARIARRISRLAGSNGVDLGFPWRTVRDAIGDLPEIPIGHSSSSVANHYLNPGARAYVGHDGSEWDRPAKTLKAGAHGVPGGENTIRLANDEVRYFSVRECARLQTFPDDWFFEGAWTEAMRQLGNAVPVDLAETMARALLRALILSGTSLGNVMRPNAHSAGSVCPTGTAK